MRSRAIMNRLAIAPQRHPATDAARYWIPMNGSAQRGSEMAEANRRFRIERFREVAILDARSNTSSLRVENSKQTSSVRYSYNPRQTHPVAARHPTWHPIDLLNLCVMRAMPCPDGGVSRWNPTTCSGQKRIRFRKVPIRYPARTFC